VNLPQAAAETYRLAEGVIALPRSLLWLERSRVLVAADAHLAYEEVIGGAFPLWSTPATIAWLSEAAERMDAREIVMLGDVIHGSTMSDGAARVVAGALAALRNVARVTLVAGNHEGRSRGAAVLGSTEESIERDGWLLVHGDAPIAARRAIVGHVHPSLPLAAGDAIPAFLGCASLIVVPALTPYSNGLNVLSRSCTDALHVFVPSISGIEVVASTDDRVYPFGSLGALCAAMMGERSPRSLRRSQKLKYRRIK
jgi:uncharacterized protein